MCTIPGTIPPIKPKCAFQTNPNWSKTSSKTFQKNRPFVVNTFFMNKRTCKTSRRVLVGRIRDILKMSSMRISCARCSDVLCTTEKKSACFFHRKKVTTFCFLGIEKYDKYVLNTETVTATLCCVFMPTNCFQEFN